jgi:GNAT superfamily N-acetyltransferase
VNGVEHNRGEYTLSDDPARIDAVAVHAYLTRSYWAEGISLNLVKRCVAGSVCFGVYHATDGQVGFARIVTDRATFGYLCDVYVLEGHRRRGLSKWMMVSVMAHPDLQGLRRFVLVTQDAHELYRQFGFAAPTHPERYMDIARPGLYLQPPQT